MWYAFRESSILQWFLLLLREMRGAFQRDCQENAGLQKEGNNGKRNYYMKCSLQGKLFKAIVK